MSASPNPGNESITSKTASGDVKTLSGDGSHTLRGDSSKRSAFDSLRDLTRSPHEGGSLSSKAKTSPPPLNEDAIMSNNEENMTGSNANTGEDSSEPRAPIAPADQDTTMAGNEDSTATNTANTTTTGTATQPDTEGTPSPAPWWDREELWGLPRRKYDLPAYIQRAMDNIKRDGIQPVDDETAARYARQPQRSRHEPAPWLAEAFRKAKEELGEGSDFGDVQETEGQSDQAQGTQFIDTHPDGGFLDPNAARGTRRRMQWTAENDRHLLLFGLGRSMSRAELKAIADSFDEKPTDKAVEERLTKLRAQQRTLLRETGIFDVNAGASDAAPIVTRAPSTSRGRPAKKVRTQSEPTASVPAPILPPTLPLQQTPTPTQAPTAAQPTRPQQVMQPPQSTGPPPPSMQRPQLLPRPGSAGPTPTTIGPRTPSYHPLMPTSSGPQQFTNSGTPYELQSPQPVNYNYPTYGTGFPGLGNFGGLGGFGGFAGGPGHGYTPVAWDPSQQQQRQLLPAASQQNLPAARDQPQQGGEPGAGADPSRPNTGATATQGGQQGQQASLNAAERARRERARVERLELEKRLNRK